MKRIYFPLLLLPLLLNAANAEEQSPSKLRKFFLKVQADREREAAAERALASLPTNLVGTEPFFASSPSFLKLNFDRPDTRCLPGAQIRSHSALVIICGSNLGGTVLASEKKEQVNTNNEFYFPIVREKNKQQ